ncbi:M48 family metallopeptidase [Mucilaginibacter calamicampi]|uniref:M48 family metallopeptidase n=1 Tax=Mucilaginibacter calamicampi TaxID=1302352 RepID=A0ABW2YXX6_9SPHI
MQTIKISNIDIDVSFKDIKNVHLSVHPPNGKVTVSAPLHIDLDTVKIYAATKLSWIKKERSKILKQDRQSHKSYITRESHYLFGKRYLLEVTPASKAKVVAHHSKIELQVPQQFNAEDKHDLLYKFYRTELRNKLTNLISNYAKKMGLEPPDFGIRKMKTKWGSCSIERRHLWFNIELAKKPEACVEYIIVHEMVHLLERHHNKNFTALVDRYYPNWQVQKNILNELPLYHG